METTILTDGSILRVIGPNSLHITEFGHGVVRHTCVGRLSREFCPYVVAHGDQQIKQFGHVLFMVDGVESTVSTSFREHIEGWLRVNREVARVHILIRSKLLEMAVGVANLVAGKHVLVAHHQATEWEAVARQEAPAFKRLTAERVTQRPPAMR